MSYNPTSTIVQVVQNAQFVAPCPGCMDNPAPGLADTPANQMGPGANGKHKRGRKRGEYRRSMPICDLCKGKGVVYLNRICECGGPGVIYNSEKKVWTCGSMLCVERAYWRSGIHGGSVTGQDWSGL